MRGIKNIFTTIPASGIYNCFRRDKNFPGFCLKENTSGEVCKVGGTDKTKIRIKEELKLQPGCHESLCNPVLQARILNKHKTDLNVIVGLCVGHDSLFIKHSEAPVTSLITKDRVLGHNPAAALYTSGFYYKKLFE